MTLSRAAKKHPTEMNQSSASGVAEDGCCQGGPPKQTQQGPAGHSMLSLAAARYSDMTVAR